MRRLAAVVIAVAVFPPLAGGSEPRRQLVPEVCEAEERPALTSLAVPEPVRRSARRVELAEREERERAARRSPSPWIIAVAAGLAAAGASILLRSR